MIPFIKMNGAGNDFVIFDARKEKLALTSEQVQKIAARDNLKTQGCDQVIVMESSQKADVFMRIYNADGGEVDACGNATRCVAWLIMQEYFEKIASHEWPFYKAKVETKAGILVCQKVVKTFHNADAAIEAEMGAPRFDWDKIPLSETFNENALLQIGKKAGIAHLSHVTCVGMGNPHVVFFVDDVNELDLIERIGSELQQEQLFKKYGINVTLARVRDQRISTSVWERGVGITKSCGTAACATAVAAINFRYKQKDKDILIVQNSNSFLDVRWDALSNHVFLIGPVKEEFRRELEL